MVKRLSLGRHVLAALIVVHLAGLLLWCWPANTAGLRLVRRAVGQYLLPLGLWQGWDMFAPDPLTVNAYLDAQVTFANGSTRTWAFPRMEQMGLWDKFRYERYRKWAVDRIRPDDAANLWSDTSRFIARQYARDPAGPPRVVLLARHWRTIAAPTTRWIPIGRENALLPEERYVFFHYDVRPEDLAAGGAR